MKLNWVRLLGPEFIIPASAKQKAADEEHWVMRLDLNYSDKLGQASQCHIDFACSPDGVIEPLILANALSKLGEFFQKRGHLPEL